jgi:hypothetical protein
MNQKLEITKYVMTALGLEITDKKIKQYTHTWWQNPRYKNKGGLRLTEKGLEALQKADLACYQIKFEPLLTTPLDNGMIIWIDRTIDCPFYITNKMMWAFGEKTVVQLLMFSGNLNLWRKAHVRNKTLNTA